MTGESASGAYVSMTELGSKVDELDKKVNELSENIEALSQQIKQINDLFNDYVTKDTYSELTPKVSNNESTITELQTQVTAIQTSIGYINELEKLTNVNISKASKGDVLQYDGDCWTNISAKLIVAEQDEGVVRLNDLADVSIVNLANKQVLTWDGQLEKWTNKSVESVEGFNEDDMWYLLKANTDEKINPSHINGQDLNLNSVTTTQGAELAYGNVKLNVNAGNVTTTGNFTATKEISAYSGS